jgi:alpha-L-fucosidase
MVWDVERGALDNIQVKPWQTCTCIGDWHYKRSIYENNEYKSAANVIQMLIDIVSKNGNLLLNIPIRGDGTIDEKEVIILEEIAAWMDVNKESIFDTRPWVVFGEGPSAEKSNPVNGPGFNEGKLKYSASDVRFNQKDKILYATVLGAPAGNVSLKALGKRNTKTKIRKVELLGNKETLLWKQHDNDLTIEKPKSIPNKIAVVFKIALE